MCSQYLSLVEELSAICGYGLVLHLPHHPQLSDWDCGRACLLMSCSKPDLTQEVLRTVEKISTGDKPLWTIDLAYVCKLVEIKHLMFTITMGVTPTYKDEPFYARQDDFDAETNRINALFRNAADKGINVKEESLQLKQLLLHVAKFSKPVIVLIDCSQLYSTTDDDDDDDVDAVLRGLQLASINDQTPIPSSAVPDGTGDVPFMQKSGNNRKPAYSGHYILLVGFDLKEEKVVYHDPSVNGRYNSCTFETFEKARMSYGTDEDLLFIFPP